MISRTGNKSAEPAALGARAAFTLVELMLVMTILVTVIAVSTPTLSRFFRGRSLDSEARQLLSLTRYAQSRAVGEGVPMLLWLDAKQGAYGLEQEPGYTDRDVKAVELKLDENVQFTVINSFPTRRATMTGSATMTGPVGIAAGRLNQAQTRNHHRSFPTIRCEPDGSFSETSPLALRLTDRDGATLWLAQSALHLDYEIRSQYNPADEIVR
jgi:Tfp pilus assembly protein FimT